MFSMCLLWCCLVFTQWRLPAQAGALDATGEPLRARGGQASAAARPVAAPGALGPAPNPTPAADPKPEIDDSGTDTEDEGELIRKAQAARNALDRYIAPSAQHRERPTAVSSSAGPGVPAYAPPKKRNANAGMRSRRVRVSVSVYEGWLRF